MFGKQLLVIALLAGVVSGRFLAAPAVAKANATQVSKAQPGHNATKNVSAKVPLTEEQQIESLNAGLSSIAKLQKVFTANTNAGNSDMAGMSAFASGAMTSELGKKDSVVWSTITGMMGATAQVISQMKGKSAMEKEKLMGSLEIGLEGKAAVLRNVTEKADKIQDEQTSEYLLGLLNQHPKWSMEEQINATRTFEGTSHGTSKAAHELLKHYNASRPLAPQLAALMDAKPLPAETHAVAAKAAKMFLQLAQSFRRM